jgi:hypothetical protein
MGSSEGLRDWMFVLRKKDVSQINKQRPRNEIIEELQHRFFDSFCKFCKDLSDAEVRMAWIGRAHSADEIAEIADDYSRDIARFNRDFFEQIAAVGGVVENEGQPQENRLNMNIVLGLLGTVHAKATPILMNKVQEVTQKSEQYEFLVDDMTDVRVVIID